MVKGGACRKCGNRSMFSVRALCWVGDVTSNPNIEAWTFDPSPEVLADLIIEDTGGRSVLCMDCGLKWEVRPPNLPIGGVVWVSVLLLGALFWALVGYGVWRFVVS